VDLNARSGKAGHPHSNLTPGVIALASQGADAGQGGSPFQDERLSRLAISTAQDLAGPLQSTPMAVTNCLLISGSKVRALVRLP
jgi:hypothetical protein